LTHDDAQLQLMGAGASAGRTKANRSAKLDEQEVQDAVKRMRRAQRKRRASALSETPWLNAAREEQLEEEEEEEDVAAAAELDDGSADE